MKKIQYTTPNRFKEFLDENLVEEGVRITFTDQSVLETETNDIFQFKDDYFIIYGERETWNSIRKIHMVIPYSSVVKVELNEIDETRFLQVENSKSIASNIAEKMKNNKDKIIMRGL